ncbi:tRNA threonylcarbamoyladenosine biosynthesis protein RimN [Psychrobacter sp. Sarcosine-02u-2]|uniref:L-threonylcarbamoyladenylate synthase n=1 Tax=Psychrobacter sp. Sarcosine-02u-2 TaxID=2058324 RepID=UPI000C7AFD3F|nr:Sua5/YciO/YrdC/YwlC family protein [Psychrobacter sp. Sarcosine-02u-2]PKG84828.1 tRNA threonylcarbamoyladenosine biosynthesis protein RimN [Psychrobacter sp. Sarcosine-02u-2]
MSTSKALITDSVIEAAHWLQQGQLLAYPTESVWGIGCDPFNQQAVEQLLAIKQRPLEKGMIVVTDSVSRLKMLLNSLNEDQRQQVLVSWRNDTDSDVNSKQAHTWLLPLSENLPVSIPAWITGAHHSVAVRVIDHPLVQQLCRQVVSVHNPYGFVVSTSCNPSGQPPALTLSQAQAYFSNSDEQVGYLKGETLGYQLPSQISDARTGQVIR